MKNLTKFSMAVAALFTVACTTDVAEELGVQLGGDGQTVISLSLEESRTQLGEKAGEVYPLVWSDGDKISVNGIESNAAIIDDTNKASAKFTFGAELGTPYSIAYPAAPAGQVLFADKQAHTSNTTFGKGVATMYAYSESGVGLQLNHLTGVLKIGVVGSAKLTMAQISTIDRAPIAGAFDLNFATGELKASTAAKELIEYSFGEGVQLSAEPTYIHVAVPAGVYDELYVTLYDVDGGVMYATVKAGESKPLSVGKVREFTSNINYAATDQVFVVKDVATLKAFAKAAPTLDKDVIFVADVDMSGEAWTPIEGYAKTVRGNGYAIKGLTAPLFGTTNASFKGLHLRDVNINETVTPNVGTFARRITATDTLEPSIENCTASGKIVVNCTEYVYKELSKYYEFSVGGIVGTLLGVAISDCSSSVAIDIDQQVATSNAVEVIPTVGGVVGSLAQFDRTDETIVYSPMVNCSNSGDIEYANGSYNGEKDYVRLSLGGVIGMAFNGNRTAEISNLTNSGDITLDATFSTYDSRVGGIIGWAYTNTLSKCVNSGNFTYNSGGFHYFFYGGIVGYAAESSIINDVHNNGSIYMKKEVKQIQSLVLGGIVGYQQNADDVGTGDLNNAINDGAITIEANMSISTTTNYFRVGGIAGWSQCENNNNTNNKEIKISGSLYNAHSGANSMCVGGVIGYKTVDAVRDVENNGEIIVSAPVSFAEKADCRLYVAGITGYGTTVIDNAKNTGNIEVTGATQGYLGIGGIAGWFGSQVTNIENTGDIKVKATSINQNSYISGCLAATTAQPDTGYILSNHINRGSINVEADSCSGLWIGGCLGFWNKQKAVALRAAENYGAITVKATSSYTEVRVGGVIGYLYGTSNSRGLHNHKSATINVDVDVTGGMLAVGGIASGLRDALDAARSGEPANGNDADIFVTGSTKTTLDVGGIICTPNNYARTSITNNGNITITGATVGTDLRVGGFECHHNYGTNSKNIVNNGDITIDSTTKVQGSAGVGGFAGGNSVLANEVAQTYDNCRNTGNITFSGEAGLSGTGHIRMGGLMAVFNCAVTPEVTPKDSSLVFANDGFTNTGDITYNGQLHSTDGEVTLGGIVGLFLLNTKDNSAWTGGVTNTGKVSCLGSYKSSTYVGGLMGVANRSFANCAVNCEVIVPKNANGAMVVGSPRSESLIISNTQVGGKLSRIDTEDNSLLTTDITATNFFDYIYGGTTDWSGVENYDGCTYISE